jgi:hypothetical protein
VLASLVLGQRQRRPAQAIDAQRVPHDTLGIVSVREPAVPVGLWIEGNVRSLLALAEARIPEQVCLGLAAKQLNQTSPKR